MSHPFTATARSALTLLAMLAATAQAQQAPSSEQNEAEQAATLKEVTVQARAEGDATTEGSGSFTTTRAVATATRLPLTLRETPQSVTVITRERMEQQGLANLTDALNASTGIYTSHLDTQRYSYMARGYAVDNFQVDGMLNTFSYSYSYMKTNGDMAIYDRVEVVRGAAGLTTGAGDPSATVNQVRKRLTRHWQGQAAVAIGSHALRRGELDLSGPLAFDGRVRGRLVAALERANSFRPMYRTRNSALYGISRRGPHRPGGRHHRPPGRQLAHQRPLQRQPEREQPVRQALLQPRRLLQRRARGRATQRAADVAGAVLKLNAKRTRGGIKKAAARPFGAHLLIA